MDKKRLKVPDFVSSTQQPQEQKSLKTSSFLVCADWKDEELTTGIGGFTILDDKITDGEDAGVNFFLEEESIGRPRAEEAYKFVSELNPDVRGDCVVQVLVVWAIWS